jgi:UDP-N-acetylglucosamine:LPS N-acetylglucosamine transferase
MADKARLEKMSEAMQALARPDASARIAGLIKDLAKSSKQAGSTNVRNWSD